MEDPGFGAYSSVGLSFEVNQTRPTLEQVTSTVAGLKYFVEVTTARIPVAEQQPHSLELIDVPEELWNGGDAMGHIWDAGPVLVDALADPATAEQALDCFLDLDSIGRIEPDLKGGVDRPFIALEYEATRSLDRIIEGTDEVAAVKALQLILRYAARGSYSSPALLQRHLPRAIAYCDRSAHATTTPQARLYADLLDAMSLTAPAESAPDAHVYSPHLLGIFLNSLGLNRQKFTETWRLNGKKEDASETIRNNLATIIELEQMEPGLTRKIHDEFKTTMFSRRTAWMQADIYKQKHDNPRAPYVLSLVSNKDGNGALSNPISMEIFYRQLRKRGIRLEEYECADLLDADDVARNAINNKEATGSEIVDLIVDTHGGWNGILFNEYYGYGKGESAIKYLAEFSAAMQGLGRVILGGCSLGARKPDETCIAQLAADVTGHETVATSVDAGCFWTVKVKDSRPYVEPAYVNPDTRATLGDETIIGGAIGGMVLGAPLFYFAAVQAVKANIKQYFTPTSKTANG